MNTYFQILNILLVATFSRSVYAQNSWTLDDCVSYAIEHNLQIEDYKYTKNSNKETYRQSVRNLLPSVEGQSSYSIRYGRSTDPFTNNIVNSDFFNNNYSLKASMILFQGFQKMNSIKAAKFLYKAAIEDIEQQKYLLAFRVMSAYYDIKFYEGLVRNSKDQAKISKSNYELVRKQVELGLKAGSDLYEAEALLLGDKLLVSQNENSMEATKLILMQEMNLSDIADITLNNDAKLNALRTKTINIDSVFLTAKNFIPSLKAEDLRAKAAKKDLAVARGKLFPEVSIGSGYNTGYYETTIGDNGDIISFKNQFKDNASHYFGVAIVIPISNAWSGRSLVKQQKINLSRAQNNVQTQEQELFKIIQQLVQEFNALQVEIKQSNKKMEAQELAFSLAQKKYEKGLINSLNLFQAKNLFGTAQNENLQVRLRLKVSEKKLDFYSGLPVFNIE